MFLHVRSEILRDKCGDMFINLSNLHSLDCFKVKYNETIVWKVYFEGLEYRVSELYPTEESARQRMAQVLIMLNEHQCAEAVKDFHIQQGHDIEDFKASVQSAIQDMRLIASETQGTH